MRKCTNSEPGTFNHECGKPATWLGTHRSGHVQAFCDRCKADGYEARPVKQWERIDAAQPALVSSETAYGRTVGYPFNMKVF